VVVCRVVLVCLVLCCCSCRVVCCVVLLCVCVRDLFLFLHLQHTNRLSILIQGSEYGLCKVSGASWRTLADIEGDVCSSTLNRFLDTWHSGRAHSKMWFRKPVECGAADIALYVRRLAPLTLHTALPCSALCRRTARRLRDNGVIPSLCSNHTYSIPTHSSSWLKVPCAPK